MRTLEKRIEHIEALVERQCAMIEEIHAMLTTGQVPAPGREELDRALADMMQYGSVAGLDRYIRRGGVVPECAGPQYVTGMPTRAHAERPVMAGKPTAERHNRADRAESPAAQPPGGA